MKSLVNISSFTKQMFIRQYIPAFISAVVFAVADMADALVVGNRMGTLGLAAISFSIPVYMFFNVIMHSFGMGGAILFSKEMAEGNEKRARSSFQGIVVILVALGIVIAVLGNLFLDKILFILGAAASGDSLKRASGAYLRILLSATPFFFFDYSVAYFMRNDDMEKEALVCATIGNITDFSLNIILVLFLNMGVRGAGFATMTGVILTSCLELIFIHQKKSHLKLTSFSPYFKTAFEGYKIGIASCVSYIYSFVFIWTANNAMVRLAGETGVAVFDVVQNISNMMLYLFGAVNQAAQPILSTYESECNYDECDKTEGFSKLIIFINSVVLMLVLIISAPAICGLFGIRITESVAFGAYAIRIFSLGILFMGMNLAIANYYTSRTIFFPSLLVSTLRGVAILLPLTFVCAAIGSYAFWFLYPVTELLSLIIISVYLKFFYRKARRIDSERIFAAMLTDDPAKIGEVTPLVEAFCEKWEANAKQLYYVQMTIEEMCAAIITNGFLKENLTNGKIQLTLVFTADREFALHIRDNAVFFDPFSMDKADVSSMEGNASDFNSLGMDVIKKKAKDFYYRRYQGFNTMVVKI